MTLRPMEKLLLSEQPVPSYSLQTFPVVPFIPHRSHARCVWLLVIGARSKGSIMHAQRRKSNLKISFLWGAQEGEKVQGASYDKRDERAREIDSLRKICQEMFSKGSRGMMRFMSIGIIRLYKIFDFFQHNLSFHKKSSWL